MSHLSCQDACRRESAQGGYTELFIKKEPHRFQPETHPSVRGKYSFVFYFFFPIKALGKHRFSPLCRKAGTHSSSSCTGVFLPCRPGARSCQGAESVLKKTSTCSIPCIWEELQLPRNTGMNGDISFKRNQSSNVLNKARDAEP